MAGLPMDERPHDGILEIMDPLPYPGLVIEKVGIRMVDAGWLEKFTFFAECGFSYQWSRKGSNRVFLVRRVIDEFGLALDSKNPKLFTDECSTTQDTSSMGFEGMCRDFWISCLSELGLDSDESSLWAFVQIVNAGGEDSTNLWLSELVNLHLKDIFIAHGRSNT
jgi:hypothetical protein